MAAVMNSSMNSTSPASALGIPEGARRASEGMPRAAAAPDPEVFATARRRQFSAGEKRALLAEADCCKQAGTLGAFLRSKRIYSSMLSSWRKIRLWVTSGITGGLLSYRFYRPVIPARGIRAAESLVHLGCGSGEL